MTRRYQILRTQSGDLQVLTGVTTVGYIYKQFHGDMLFYRAVYEGVTHIESKLCTSRKNAYNWIVRQHQKQ